MVEEPGQGQQRVREADLQRHLSDGKAGPAPAKPAATDKPAAQPAVPPGGQPKPIELGSKDDFQLVQAIAHLKGEPVKGQPSKTVAENAKPGT